MKQFILTHIISNGKVNANRCNISWFENHNFIKEYNQIFELTNHLLPDTKFSERLYNIIYDVSNNCNNLKCNNPKKFYTYTKGYANYCSLKCSNSCSVKKDKNVTTLQERYNVDNISQLEKIKLKKKSTKKQNFGDENFNNRKQAEETCLQKYGVNHQFKSVVVKNKTKKTNIQRYGVDNIFKNTTYIKQCVFEKYGVDNINQLISYRNEISKRQTGENNIQVQRILTEQNITYKQYIQLMSDYELYSNRVRAITKKQPIHKLKYYNERGVHTYHLDHKYSISEGFMNNVNPYLIGNINNLEFIPAHDNCSKGSKCSINQQKLQF